MIVLTGKTDYVSDGHTVVALSNGHPYLAGITGSGCMVGTSVATFCAGMSMTTKSDSDAENGRLTRGDMFLAAIGGYVSIPWTDAHATKELNELGYCIRVLAITIASEFAGVREDVKGTGTFLPALIDELGKLEPETLRDHAKLEIIHVSYED